MDGAWLGERQPRRWTRLLVGAAAILPLLTMLTVTDGHSDGDVLFSLLACAVPALPLLAHTSPTFARICLVEAPLLIVIGVCGAIGGLFIVIPSAIVLTVAGVAELGR